TAARIGVGAATLCAVHCALLPVLIGLAQAGGLALGGWVDFDHGAVVFASLLAATTPALGYPPQRASLAWALLVPALALVWLGSFTRLHDHTWAHLAVMVAGGLLLAGAHLANLRLTHAARAAAER